MVIDGDGNDNILNGTPEDDIINGKGGNDTLNGGGGNDVLTGGDGFDTLEGGAGNDMLIGGSNTDTASYRRASAGVTVSLSLTDAQNTGGAGTDTLVSIARLTGSKFNDILTGDAGNNILIGGDGFDTLEGGAGNDMLIGGSNTDTASYSTASSGVTVTLLFAGAQDTGGAGIDTLSSIARLAGSAFNDILTGDDYANLLNGAGGNDLLEGGAGNDSLIGGSGNDTASYANAVSAVTVSLALTGPQNTGGAGTDTLNTVEHLIGSAFNDVLAGDGNANIIEGGDGNDTVSYASAASAVTVNLALIGPQNTLSAGIDTLSSIEHLTGSNSGDTLTGDDGDNILNGGNGLDTLEGGAGNDILSGGAGTDTASYRTASEGVIVDLNQAGRQDTDGAGLDTLNSIARLIGSAFNDVLYGAANDNLLNGGAGHDVLSGGSGNDSLIGGDGNDSLEGGADNDLLEGGAGNDYLNGGTGNDSMVGGSGNDTASYTGAGAAVIVSLELAGAQNTGGAGTDTLAGFENLTGSSRSDTLTGDAGDNILDGDYGNDVLKGGAGNDTLIGSGGNDVLEGGAGNDNLFGHADNDTASYAGAATAVTVSLLIAGAQNTGGAGTDTLSLIEHLIGSAFNDVLTGDGNANIIEGGAGNDNLNGGSGNDTASYAGAGAGVTVHLVLAGAQNTGGAGTDILSGFENLIGSDAGDTLTGNGGDNILDGGNGNDILQGGTGNDTLIGGGNTDLLEGGTGNDVLEGGAGNDSLTGGSGNDAASYAGAGAGVTVSLALAGTQNTGGAGSDTLSSIEHLIGSAFNDVLTGDGNANIIEGGTGNDNLNGGGGNDTASYARADAAVTVSLALAGAQNTGGVGTDTLAGFENITGSAFNDTLTGDAGNNILDGGSGFNTLQGGAGNDMLIGGTNFNTASYSAAASGVTVSLALAGPQNTGSAGIDTLVSIDFLTGSAFNDALTGDANTNLLDGGAGNDVLEGGAGNDSLVGGSGNDAASYAHATAAVTIKLGLLGPQNTQGAGTDMLGQIESIVGSAFDDWLTGEGNANLLAGGAGNDRLDGGAGNDLLEGGAGNDRLDGDSGADILEGGAGDDLLIGGGGTGDTASYSDATMGVTVSLVLPGPQNTGGAGIDTLASIERLIGSAFKDSLTGDANANLLEGGGGNDLLEGGAGNDSLLGGSGNDTFLGGTGADIFIYRQVSDSIATSADVIGDLTAQDILDFRTLDADSVTAGVQHLVEVQTLSGTAGEFTLTYDAGDNESMMAADIDGNAVADFVILFDGDVTGFTSNWLFS